MCGFVHIAAGAAAGQKIKSPWSAGLFGLILHAMLDVLPHYDFLSILNDFIAQIFTIILIIWVGGFKRNTLICAFFSVFPDIEIVLKHYGYIKKSQLVYPTHTFIPQIEIRNFTGIITNLLVFGLAIYWLYKGREADE